MTSQGPSGKVPIDRVIWPITLLGTVLIGGLVAIILTGHDTAALTRSIAALGATASTLLSAGAYLKSTQAAKQTNGELDKRMHEAVHNGITTALATANAQQARRPPRRPAPTDPPTEKITPPAA